MRVQLANVALPNRRCFSNCKNLRDSHGTGLCDMRFLLTKYSPYTISPTGLGVNFISCHIAVHLEGQSVSANKQEILCAYSSDIIGIKSAVNWEKPVRIAAEHFLFCIAS